MEQSLLAISLRGTIYSMLLSGCCLLSACAATTPMTKETTNNACKIFQKNPDWYWEALNTYKSWGVPISVQLAIIQRESDFQAGAKPPRKKFLGFIPTWGHITSAYGYAQALNKTWIEYQKQTHNYRCHRDRFGDSSEFIGWYSYKAHQKYKISLHDAYHLYLAYHEGLAGYGNQTYLQKPWLLEIAKEVQTHANIYRQQIRRCKYSIPKTNQGF